MNDLYYIYLFLFIVSLTFIVKSWMYILQNYIFQARPQMDVSKYLNYCRAKKVALFLLILTIWWVYGFVLLTQQKIMPTLLSFFS